MAISRFSCDRTDWRTPDHVVDVVRRALGGRIILDPCTTDDNPTNAYYYCTPEQDGLLADWDDQTFINPPYGEHLDDWLCKFRDESLKLPRKRMILLIPVTNRFATKKFQVSLLEAHLTGICFPRKRIDFEGKNNNPYASALWCAGRIKWSVLEEMGKVIRVR